MSDDEKEAAYEAGSRMAWLQILNACLMQLGYDSDEVRKVAWVSERESAIVQLRLLCADFGDNDWPADLHLGDIIGKHLGDRLRAPKP